MTNTTMKPETLTEWEVEIKVRRNGRLWRRESALGSDPLHAYYCASNDLERDLQEFSTSP